MKNMTNKFKKNRKATDITRNRQLISGLDTRTPLELIRSLPDDYQGVPISYFYHPSTDDWLAAPSIPNPNLSAKGKYRSRNGAYIKSELELQIANHLEDHGLLYRYNAAALLGDETIYPTFTIKNPFDGQGFFWEHFEILDRPENIQKMNDKMALYIEHGHIPFETIIFTCELDAQNPQRLQSIIRNIIL